MKIYELKKLKFLPLQLGCLLLVAQCTTVSHRKVNKSFKIFQSAFFFVASVVVTSKHLPVSYLIFFFLRAVNLLLLCLNASRLIK